MRRSHTIGVRLSDKEMDALSRLRELRGFEGTGQLIRALLREEICRNEENAATSLAIVRHATAGTN